MKIINIDINKNTLKDYMKAKIRAGRSTQNFWEILSKIDMGEYWKCEIKFY